jgi:hypothetical protein
MLPTPEQVKALTDLGGFALFVFVISFGAVAIHRQWLVPGWVFRNEVDRRVKAEATVERLTRSVRTALARRASGDRLRDEALRDEALRGERRLAGDFDDDADA